MDDLPSQSSKEGQSDQGVVGTAVSGTGLAGKELRSANRKMTLQLTLIAVGFLGFGFALVPLYDVLCKLTGYGSRKNLTQATTLTTSDSVEQVAQRDVTVEFISTMPTVGEWEFRPVENSAKVRTGQLYAAKFVAKNLLAMAATGQAVPSIAPHEASPYFRKTECFCFSPQHFEAGQERELIVRFVVDPQLPKTVDRITLAYSMYGVQQKLAAK
jgi:cytochrome c oxidase assembly protein subunit 11